MNRSLDALETDLRFNLSRTFNRSFNRPDWVSINLTLRCNLHCAMCTTCYDAPNELSKREIFDIIDQVALWGVRILNPLGGEPFIRSDIVEILEYACLKDFYITLTTNGTLIPPEVAAGIARIAYNRLHFNFSIDGFEAVHDRIRGKGMLEKTLEGLHNLREADAAAGNSTRKIQVNTVVNNLNLDSLPEFLETCKAQGFQGVQLLNLFKQGPEIPRKIKHLWIPRERLPVLDQRVREVLAFKKASDPQTFAVVNTEHELEIMKLYYRDALPPRQARCYAGWKELYINADGHAIMCDGHLDFLKGQFGDVRKQTLQQIWSSEELSERRRAVKACQSPCIQDCYLRESSDSMIGIARDAGVKILSGLRRRWPRRSGKASDVQGSELLVELSDVSDLCPCHGSRGAEERFAQFVATSPVPFDRCYEDPFRYYEMRNRGYLNFNRGFLGFEVVKRFIPDLARAGLRFESLGLGLRGDPLLHPEFTLIYRYLLENARAHGLFGEIRIDTFGTMLNTEYVDLAIEANLVPQTFAIWLNAASRETYGRVNGKDLHGVVLERLDYLLAMKAKHRAEHIRLVFVFTALETNVHEAGAFVDFWSRRLDSHGLDAPEVLVATPPKRHRGSPSRDIAPPQAHQPGSPSRDIAPPQAHQHGSPSRDVVFFKRMDNDNFLDQLKSNEALSTVAQSLGKKDVRIDRDQGRSPRCAAPFKTPTVTWDGKVTVCDQDPQLKLKVGEVTSQNLAEVWGDGRLVAEIRRAVARGDLATREPCRDCRQPFSPNAPTLTEAELEQYSGIKRRGGWSV